MQFQDGNLYELVFGQSQHLRIPDFQRAYSWDQKMWATLWIDILHQYKIHADLVASNVSEDEVYAQLAASPTHYLGAIVTTSGNALPPPQSDVLDGQQRLLTSSIIYLAVRDSLLNQIAPGEDADELVQELKENFRQAYFNPLGTEKTKYKLHTQDVDRESWEYLLGNQRPIGLVKRSQFQAGSGHSERVIQAFNYFFKEMNRTVLEDNKFQELEFARALFPLDIKILRNVVETRLSLVRLQCAPSDDANAIFESLNAKSEPLKQVDLIKNYIYISLPTDEASEIYRGTWRPMELSVGSSRIERFVWAVVVSSGSTTLQKRTYETVRRLLANKPKTEIKKWVQELHKEAKYYKSIVEPSAENDLEVRAALKSVQMAGGATLEPLLMYAYRCWSTGNAEKQQLIASIKSMESFLVRRMLAGEKTQVLNPMVTAMINRLHAKDGEFEAEGNLTEDIRRVLSSIENAWPDSDALLKGIRTDNFYASQKSDQRQHVLRTLDRFLNSTGVVPNYEDSDKSIEHIIPQTPTAEWGVSPGDVYPQEIRERLHSLSNLTLLPSTVNASLGNRRWQEKSPAYGESGYSITRKIFDVFGTSPTWGIEQLDARALDLSDLADRIWPRDYVAPRYVPEEKLNTEPELIDEFSVGSEETFLEDELDVSS
jgi:hypothetical protein